MVIGLTGAFGSGCSTATGHLRHERGFQEVKLSSALRVAWKESGGSALPNRSDLQRLGDDLRKAKGTGVLVDLSLKNIDHTKPIVVDGVRNVGEVESLRKLFGYNFVLMAILASSETRWSRIQLEAYLNQGLTEDDFQRDDARDQNEETPWGQQVELCVDQADIFVDNSGEVDRVKFKEEVLAAADLVSGKAPRAPTQEEIQMHMAYAASHTSMCLRRHVGAVVVDQEGNTIATGFNENPRPTKPCALEDLYGRRCYRDLVRNTHFATLRSRGVRCPECGEPLGEVVGPPWTCKACAAAGRKTNLEEFFFPDRAMN